MSRRSERIQKKNKKMDNDLQVIPCPSMDEDEKAASEKIATKKRKTKAYVPRHCSTIGVMDTTTQRSTLRGREWPRDSFGGGGAEFTRKRRKARKKDPRIVDAAGAEDSDDEDGDDDWEAVDVEGSEAIEPAEEPPAAGDPESVVTATESGGTATTESGGAATTESGGSMADEPAEEPPAAGDPESGGTATESGGSMADELAEEPPAAGDPESGGTAATDSWVAVDLEGSMADEPAEEPPAAGDPESGGTATESGGSMADELAEEPPAAGDPESGGTAATDSWVAVAVEGSEAIEPAEEPPAARDPESGGTATTESGGTATTESGGTATTESGGTANESGGAEAMADELAGGGSDSETEDSDTEKKKTFKIPRQTITCYCCGMVLVDLYPQAVAFPFVDCYSSQDNLEALALRNLRDHCLRDHTDMDNLVLMECATRRDYVADRMLKKGNVDLRATAAILHVVCKTKDGVFVDRALLQGTDVYAVIMKWLFDLVVVFERPRGSLTGPIIFRNMYKSKKLLPYKLGTKEMTNAKDKAIALLQGMVDEIASIRDTSNGSAHPERYLEETHQALVLTKLTDAIKRIALTIKPELAESLAKMFHHRFKAVAITMNGNIDNTAA